MENSAKSEESRNISENNNILKNVGDNINTGIASWTFSGQVSDVFSQHVRKSVPLYEKGHAIICSLSDFFVKNHSTCFELGTSVGELISQLALRHSSKVETKWIGIDVEETMIKKAEKNYSDIKNLEFVMENILLYPYEKSDLIVSYYTIQFVHPKFRQELLNKLYQSLNWGGALILFEKVRGPDARFQDILTTLYNEFKMDNGYSADEILAKTGSLKGVLEPFSNQGNLDLLKRAGFQDIMTVMKYLCFEGFLAIK